MKLIIFIQVLFCFLNLSFGVRQAVTCQPDNPVKGKWKSEKAQIQYVVDSHLVYEQEVTTEKGNVYDFDDKKVQVKYPDGTTVQGTYAVVKAAEKQNLVLQVAGTTTTYMLISVTPTHMVWQRDLDDVNYNEGFTQKSAERAVYTEVLKK